VSQHALGDGLNVLVREVVPACQQRTGARAAQQAQGRARARPQRQVGVLPARLRQIDDVMQQRLRAVDLRQIGLQVQDQFRVEHLIRLADRHAVQLQHGHFARVAG
jgi:hypothetical protein